ncbi:hypothetical protein KAX29_00060 [candidate division WOR-3 bacterium]|nr:hypothetical protein [candidate division WOR-3 bacterium]
MLILILISKSAATAMLLTTFIPGGGQFYTKRWVKGILIGGTQSYIIYKGVSTQFDLNDINQRLKESYSGSLAQEKDALLVRRREIIWWGALVWTIGILDAYVDAQLYDFESDITMDPGGNPKLNVSINIHY